MFFLYENMKSGTGGIRNGADRVYKDIKSKMLFSIWKNRIWKRVQLPITKTT